MLQYYIKLKPWSRAFLCSEMSAKAHQKVVVVIKILFGKVTKFVFGQCQTSTNTPKIWG